MPHHKVNDLEQIVLNDLRKVCAYVKQYETEFVEDYRKCSAKESASMLSVARSEIKKAENRLFEIEWIIVKLYEKRFAEQCPKNDLTFLQRTMKPNKRS